MNNELYQKCRFKKEDFCWDGLQDLTPKETEVLKLYATLKTKQKRVLTAAIMEVTIHTIKAHLHSIYQKLNVDNELDMIIVAHMISEIDIEVDNGQTDL